MVHVSSPYYDGKYKLDNPKQDTKSVLLNPEAQNMYSTEFSAADLLQEFFSNMNGYNLGIMNCAPDGVSGGGESTKAETVDDADEEETPEESVRKILDDFKDKIDTKNGEITNDMFKYIVAKYKTIKTVYPNITKEQLNDRIVNYTNALIFHNVEVQGSGASTQPVEYQSKCSEAKTQDELIEKYQQFGMEYVELYDNGNNSSDDAHEIDIHEMFYQTLIDNYIAGGATRKEAIQNAIRVTGEYKQYGLTNLPNDNSPETELFLMCANKISYIDTMPGATPDGVISNTEAAAYLFSTAQLADNKNNITSLEFQGSEYAIAYSDSDPAPTIETIKEDLGCDDKKAQNILTAIQNLRENMEFSMPVFNPKPKSN